MTYKYTEEGCFKGELLKEPPLPAFDEKVIKRLERVTYKGEITGSPRRRWLHYGCAVEELGRFGCWNPNINPVEESAFVWWLHDQLANPQTIANNDGFGVEDTNDKGEYLFAPRYVIAALVDEQIKRGVARVLEEYFGFTRLAPFFGNTEKVYGNNSRIGLYGVCTTRYLAEEHQYACEHDSEKAS